MFYLSDKKEARSVYIVPEMSYRCWSLLTESGQLCSMKPRDPRVFVRRETLPESSASRMSFVTLRTAASLLW